MNIATWQTDVRLHEFLTLILFLSPTIDRLFFSFRPHGTFLIVRVHLHIYELQKSCPTDYKVLEGAAERVYSKGGPSIS